MDAEDLELFERSLAAATNSSAGADLDARLAEVGWVEALSIDPQAPVATLFSLQGRANTTSSALGQVIRDALGVDEDVPVLLPAVGTADPAGRAEEGRVTVAGLASSLGDRALVVAVTGGTVVAGTVPLAELTVRTVQGIDPWLELHEVTGNASFTAIAPADWTFAVSRARLALGHELVGASRRMLELAREHAVDRVQFGQPIVKFQVVRHRLADTLIAVEIAEALLGSAWEDGLAETAAMAKAGAGRAGRITARHCQQVLAGVGFTTEHDLQRYIKRVFMLDELFGSARALTAELGRDLLDTRKLPPLLPL